MKPIRIELLEKHVDFGYFKSGANRKTIKRSIKEKIKAWKLDVDYYDGDRLCGYGGFRDDGRWLTHLPNLLQKCSAHTKDSIPLSILDLGCKKGFLVDAATQLGYSAIGIENHRYPLDNASKNIKHKLIQSEYHTLPFAANSFDFCIGFSSIYMQNLKDVICTLQEIQRVSTKSFISVAAYNDPWERDSFYDWTLLGTTLLHCSEWLELFETVGYRGHYFFTTPSALGFTNND